MLYKIRVRLSPTKCNAGPGFGAFCMTVKTEIFIDGENLRKAVEKYRFEHQGGRYYYLRESLINWNEFFNNVLNEIKNRTGFEHRLVTANWYVADKIRVVGKSSRVIRDTLEQCNNKGFQLNEDDLKKRAEDWLNKERDRVRRESEEIRQEIEEKYDFLHFKYVGEFLLNPYQLYDIKQENDETIYLGTRLGERGVDVGLAVDLVAAAGSIDAAVLVSGDRD